MVEKVVPVIDTNTKIKVSSALDRSAGKKYLTDGNPETCWTSRQGTPQYIQMSFEIPVIPKRIELTFQGGFVGTKCSVEALTSKVSDEAHEWQVLTRIYPEDVNRKQEFQLVPGELDVTEYAVQSLKLVFEESSDFFGRITVYDLQVLGILSS